MGIKWLLFGIGIVVISYWWTMLLAEGIANCTPGAVREPCGWKDLALIAGMSAAWGALWLLTQLF